MSMKMGEGMVEDCSWADVSLLVGLPMAVRAALVLNIPKIIDSAFPTLVLSAEEICKRISESDTNHDHSASPQHLEKLMDWLCCNSVFSMTMEEEGSGGGSKVKKYGHSPKSRCLTIDQTADALLMYTSPEMTAVWPHAHQSVINPNVCPFELVTGKFLYRYFAEDAPEIQRLYVRMLKRTSTVALKLIVAKYDEEFKSLKGTVVDVGGQEGAMSAGLAAKYSHLEFVNFDLPEVVRAAPPIPQVKHVGGSFHDKVPEGNLLFMKFCLLNWNDEACVRILTNCRNALVGTTGQQSGKILIIDRLDRSADTPTARSEDVARTASAWSNFQNSIVMSGSRTRTLEEFRTLALASGFSKLVLANHSPGFDLMEASINL